MRTGRQISVARRWWLPLVIGVGFASGVAFVASSLLPQVYEAEATMIVGTSLTGTPDYNELLVSQQLAQTYATVAKTRPILDRVKAALQLEESTADLAERISAVAEADTALLTITGSDGDPEGAALLVNALVDQLIASSPGGDDPSTDVPQAVDEQLAAIRSQMDTAQARLEELAAVAERTAAQQAELVTLDESLRVLRETYATLIPFSTTNAPNLLTVLDPASPPNSPSSPRPTVNALVAGMAAALIVGAIAFVVEYPARPRGTP